MPYKCTVCKSSSAHPGMCICGMAYKTFYQSETQVYKPTPDRFDVVIYSENNGFYSGGRYYSWQFAHALAEVGLKVCFYTNMKPIFDSDFLDYEPFTVVLGEFRKPDNRSEIKANCYIGSPVFGNILASERAGDKPCYLMIFDPLNQIKEYHPEDFKMETQYHSPMFDSINNRKNKIICLTQYGKEGIYSWLDRELDEIEEIYPAINSRVAGKIKLLSTSRVVGRKNYQDTIEVLSKLPKNYELDVITSTGVSDLNEMVKKLGLGDRVKVHFQLDDRAKFDLYRSADIVINTTLFEGFGMWMTEAIYYGKPVVCYDFPTFREIDDMSDSDIRLAKRRDVDDFVKKVMEVEIERDQWTFDVMVGRVGEVFSKYKTIRIGWIADFFEEKKGGAQKTNEIMIEEGEKRGFVIDRIKTSEVMNTNLSNYDLLIVNNIAMSNEAIRARIMSHRYIRYEHDYLFNYFDQGVIKGIFKNAVASIFLSPLHRAIHKEILGDSPSYVVNSPIQTSLFRRGEKNGRVMWAGELVTHKGIENVLD
jgi:glycosyltransferase involved in cell wall biosynthesis